MATKTKPEAAPIPDAQKADPNFIPPAQGERLVDPHRQALQRAAQLDHARRMDPSNYTPLPNGEFVRNVGRIDFKHPQKKVTDMMMRAREMLEAPKPEFVRWSEHERRHIQCGHRYVWLVRVEPCKDQRRDAETSNLHRAGRIRYVETSEIDPGCPFAVYTPYGTTNNEYVTHAEFILCEIQDPELAYEMGPAWADYALSRVQELPDIVREGGELGPTRIEGETDTDVAMRDVKQEASGPMYRSNPTA